MGPCTEPKTNLASDSAFQRDGGVRFEKLEFLEDIDTLFVVRYQFKILIRDF